jgi:hypothetical protein
MGKLDIDYQVLHDAFFKFQNKPQLTGLGEVYYEGKEFDLSVKSAKAGVVTPAMREALGMAPNAPPPWLINMQRYGPLHRTLTFRCHTVLPTAFPAYYLLLMTCRASNRFCLQIGFIVRSLISGCTIFLDFSDCPGLQL